MFIVEYLCSKFLFLVCLINIYNGVDGGSFGHELLLEISEVCFIRETDIVVVSALVALQVIRFSYGGLESLHSTGV